ncbi:MAG: TRAP transporter small permease [Desulfobacterota bacterium]|nr:TRAP transporter small permease [Thermodesulfobacteriota bacterium]
MLSRFLDRILTGMAVLAGLFLLFITFSISYGIFTRALNLPSPVWTIQFNEYSLLWMTFLGSAWALSRRKHVAVDILTSRLGPESKRIAEVAHSLVGMVLCGVLCWYSALMTLNFFQRGVTDVQAVDMPKSLILLVIPAGFLVLTAQFLRNLTASLGRKKSDAQRAERQEPASDSTIGSPEATAEGRKG